MSQLLGMSNETVKALSTNLGCLLLTLVGMYLFNKAAPRIERWAKHYFVYRHYPPEYQRQCVCGETFLMHEGDGGRCVSERSVCRKFIPTTTEET